MAQSVNPYAAVAAEVAAKRKAEPEPEPIPVTGQVMDAYSNTPRVEPPAPAAPVAPERSLAQASPKKRPNHAYDIGEISWPGPGEAGFSHPYGSRVESFECVPIARTWERECYLDTFKKGGDNTLHCFSKDCLTGTPDEGSVDRLKRLGWTGDCETCALATPGTDPRGGKGAACGERQRWLVIENGAPEPWIVSVPRTGIKALRPVERRMGLKNLRRHVTRWSLDGHSLTFEVTRELPPQAQEQAEALYQQMLAYMVSIGINVNDHELAPEELPPLISF